MARPPRLSAGPVRRWGEREDPGSLPLPLPHLHPLLPAEPWSRLTPSTEPRLPAATAAASRRPSEPEAWVRGRGTSTHSCSPCRGGHRGPAPHPKPWVRPTLPRDPSPRAGGVVDQGHLGVGRVHRPPEPLRPHLCLHRFADPRGQELATVPISTFPRGLPGYFPNEIKSSEAEQCPRGQRGLGKEG